MADPIIPELQEDPVAAVRAGLPVKRFDHIRRQLSISEEELLHIMDVSRSTLDRRRKSGTFKKTESERLARVAQIFDHAVDTTGSEEAARRWLTSAQYGLDGQTPLSYLDTEQGACEVDHLLGRIDYGIAL